MDHDSHIYLLMNMEKIVVIGRFTSLKWVESCSTQPFEQKNALYRPDCGHLVERVFKLAKVYIFLFNYFTILSYIEK